MEINQRESGILLHITSLPSSHGIGDLGPWAYRFAGFLEQSNQRLWQILPLNPTDLAIGNSPYSSYSAFAGNSLLISLDLLAEEDLLSKEALGDQFPFSREKIDYPIVTKNKSRWLRDAYETYRSRFGMSVTQVNDPEFKKFCDENAYWLEDYTLFAAIKTHFKGLMWSHWPEDLRDRKEDALREWKEKLSDPIFIEKFFQYTFFKQWSSLKTYCNTKKIQIIGDIPIYVTYDSSDVWANPELFKLDGEKRPTHVAGVPPDYFSKTGQLWGNPVYRWDVLKETRYTWWVRRFEHNLKLFDRVRLDHFRGFVAYWEVPANEKTAIHGTWIDVPVRDFLSTLSRRFADLPIIAEDLGVITPDVREVMNTFKLPGMKILLFAFGEDLPTNLYAPHNYEKNCVVYTGTHDNNTIQGWFSKEATSKDQKRVFTYLGREVTKEELHWEFIRLALMSVADTAILSMQDVLGLGEEARMNLPATPQGNWTWRLLPEQLIPSLIEKLSEMTKIYGRA
jgi:4-alpha-glucanotransferase